MSADSMKATAVLFLCSLTDKGKEAAKQTEHIFQHAEEPVMSALTEEEQETLKKLLMKVCGAISDNAS